MIDLLDLASFPPRWTCGRWTELHGWTHIVADLAIFGAYVAIPITLAVVVRRRADLQLGHLAWLFALFIATCGLGHVVEASLFWYPWYRLSAAVKVVTAVASWITFVALVRALPGLVRPPPIAEINDLLVRETVHRREVEAHFRGTFENAAVGIAHVDPSGRWLRTNEALSRITGYSREELAKKTSADVAHPDDATSDAALEKRLLEGKLRHYAVEKRFVRKDGSIVWVNLTISLPGGSALKRPYFIVVVQDVSDRKARDLERQRLAELVERSPGLIATADMNGAVTYLNRGGRALLGLGDATETSARVVECEALNKLFRGAVLEEALTVGSAEGDVRLRPAAKGEPIDVHQTTFLVRDPTTDEPWCFATMAHDVTVTKRADEAVRQSEARFRALVDVSAHIVWTLSGTGEAIDDSPSWRAFTGQTLEQWRGPERMDAIHPEDRAGLDAAWAEAMRERRSFEAEYRVRHSSGEWRWTSARAAPLLHADGTVREWIGMNTDTTERRRSDEQFRLAIEASPTGMLLVDSAGTIVLANAQVERLFGFDRAELVGRSIETLLPERYRARHPGLRAAFVGAPTTRAMGAGRDLYARRKDGSELPVEIALNPLRTAQGDFVLGSVLDITERKRAQRDHQSLMAELRILNSDLESRVNTRTSELAHALQDREVLLQEIHHRVKNNLQVISSLIHMQAVKVVDAKSREALEGCQTRIQAIALIHDKLYQSQNYARVPFAEYARSLATNVFHAVGLNGGRVALDLEVDDVELAIDRAIPCGLILNELITNALKHAFGRGRSGTLRVRFKRDLDQLVLLVADDGVGFPAGCDPRTSTSLGLQLVSTLAQQLEAVLEIESEVGKGASFRVAFPEVQPRHSSGSRPGADI